MPIKPMWNLAFQHNGTAEKPVPETAHQGGAGRPAQQEQIRTEIATLTAQIKELRREVKLCGDIALRSTSIKDKIQAAREEVSGRMRKPARSRSRAGRLPQEGDDF